MERSEGRFRLCGTAGGWEEGTGFTPGRPSRDEWRTRLLRGSEAEEDDGLFAGGDEEEEESGDEAMEDVTASGAGDAATNGVKRKLVEEEDYD